MKAFFFCFLLFSLSGCAIDIHLARIEDEVEKTPLIHTPIPLFVGVEIEF